ncbi:2-amino-4-hydroxy-6-hydroxymethyldihydropteridine diphosphokinase [Flavipsychrobacter stenotrophus]|uniref:2-amino-4-hydroxy-6-hydroxymethyldihydropteridine pyrophosphokinase n=1 Tax=Flavipsychrobacter stenotrophus TaxID=2077091 RepID=A0A2S7SR42_9BACT|nr:2-amino-4-hydroxy-6-hydroxymethyldihydropteridine diphosphokinase [Flavipsychrobacter stenotrophus]PQJ09026.1 2-amino-4-hydroxy-6-hydroxymethyldihydropteridine diphosphokinase [Flavipsychrobacter stenotrophus]
MHTTYLSLGSNIGDRQALMTQALAMLEVTAGRVVKQSALYATKAWGITDQPDFLNMCAAIETDLSAQELLATILQTERNLGRERKIKWGERTIDIDILFYDDAIINEHDLIVPHPYIQDRRFILVPMAEIAPDLVHPVLNKTINRLLKDCKDELQVQCLDKS